MNHNRSSTKKIGAGVLMLCAAESGFAADQLTISGGASLEFHDNAPLTTKKESDLIRVANVDIGYKKPEGSVTLDLNYQFERHDYLHNTQGDENAINGNTSLVWQIQPRQLNAVLYHQISQQMTNRSGLDVSSNREERSIITGGVDGFLHFSPVDSLIVSPRFVDIKFQDTTESNSQRSTLATTWEHKLGPLAALGLTGNYNHVTFDDSQNDYDAPSVMLNYKAALSRLSYQAGVGYNRINRDQGPDMNGSMINLSADYKGESGWNSGGNFAHQLTDSSIGFSGLEISNDNFESNDSNFEEPDTIEKDQLDLYLNGRLSGGHGLRFGVGYLKEDYQTTPRDQTVSYARIGYSYTVNTQWAIGVDARFDRTKFLDGIDRLHYDTTRTYLTATYTPLRPLEIRFSVGRDKRSANQESSSYTDNVGIVGVQYRFY
jgi:hypothetical protein